MKKQLLALIIAASVSGCAGPAGYGFGKTAESYRICAAAPRTPGCENGFLPVDRGLLGAYIINQQQRQYQQDPMEAYMQRRAQRVQCTSRVYSGAMYTDCQ
jgi:hypothetical protein